MQIEPTSLPEVQVLTPRRFGDGRGFFEEVYNRETLSSHGITTNFVQDNQSYSAETGTVRGLHFQAPPRAQAKLVRVVQGAILDVAVDIRRGSPRHGAWVAHELSAQNGRQMLVPAGFLHGFVTLMPDTIVIYKCSDTYAPASEGAVRFDDPDLAIDWRLGAVTPLLSDKDAKAPAFAALDSPFQWGEDAGQP